MNVLIFLLPDGQGWPAFAAHLKGMTAPQPKIMVDHVELRLDPDSGQYFYQLGQFCSSWPESIPAGALNLVKIIKPDNPGNTAKPGEYDYLTRGWWASVENVAAHPGSSLQVIQTIIVSADFFVKAFEAYGQILRREVEPTSAWEPDKPNSEPIHELSTTDKFRAISTLSPEASLELTDDGWWIVQSHLFVYSSSGKGSVNIGADTPQEAVDRTWRELTKLDPGMYVSGVVDDGRRYRWEGSSWEELN